MPSPLLLPGWKGSISSPEQSLLYEACSPLFQSQGSRLELVHPSLSERGYSAVSLPVYFCGVEILNYKEESITYKDPCKKTLYGSYLNKEIVSWPSVKVASVKSGLTSYIALPYLASCDGDDAYNNDHNGPCILKGK